MRLGQGRTPVVVQDLMHREVADELRLSRAPSAGVAFGIVKRFRLNGLLRQQFAVFEDEFSGTSQRCAMVPSSPARFRWKEGQKSRRRLCELRHFPRTLR